MKKYFLFTLLFAFFFPLVHKLALTILMMFYKEDPFVLVSYYHEHGLLSIRNLVISIIAGVLTYFFTTKFIRWEKQKK
ncbi:hypothetical protein ACFSCX_24240 [Bacillus salitolerans]|uniref:Uncharacterized protein n=1 Tax=Bacillus salitolerans TaxID=1437434 RepID=A0ABW4LWV5_9BACI